MSDRPIGSGSRAFGRAALIVATFALVAIGQAPSTEKPKGQAKARAAAPRPKPKAPTIDEPVVMSAEAAALARGKPSDKDKYDSGDDSPGWRKASFFGIEARGQVFIYVVDCSGSMSDDDRLDRAKSELKRSVGSLQVPQRFKVIFYNDRMIPMPGDLTRPADSASKAQLARWARFIESDGGTDPRDAMTLALAMRPDAVFLLSDGAYPPGTAQAIARSNPRKIPIHCVDLAGGAGGDDLRKIAAESGGQYASRGQ